MTGDCRSRLLQGIMRRLAGRAGAIVIPAVGACSSSGSSASSSIGGRPPRRGPAPETTGAAAGAAVVKLMTLDGTSRAVASSTGAHRPGGHHNQRPGEQRRPGRPGARAHPRPLVRAALLARPAWSR